MNKFDDNIVIKVHKIASDEKKSTARYVRDPFTYEIISKLHISSEELEFNAINSDETKVRFSCKEDNTEQMKCIQYQENFFTNAPDATEKKPLIAFLNIPTMIRCQNCETNFPTKYQYQRHQCEFNAEKVVLKPDADFKDVEKGVRIKYDCSTCGKQFVSKNNLERHQASHENTKSNVCEHCNKQFVSENRLRIHKENHCKKAGDISKFYRSDVTVWKCKKCHEVFSSVSTAGFHVENCVEVVDLDKKGLVKEDPNENKMEHEQGEVKNVPPLMDESELCAQTDIKNIEKILTEILLQCEFCNRTYADKNLLLMHSKKHTTEKNYECVNCNEVFDSYAVASQHWMKKCSEFANLFYLPKLTYCECCDRTFKSHEILYTHKIKKKHYTPKLHVAPNVTIKPTESKDNFTKLIEDVLKTLSVPVNKITNNSDSTSQFKNGTTSSETEVFDVSLEENGALHIKSENQSECGDVNVIEIEEGGKKKRGRKRRWPKQVNKAKKICTVVDDGYKYQCERCVKVFDSVMELEVHREKEHAAIFNCEECGQVLHSAKALLIHSRAHKSLKPYVCDTCGRSYSQTSHLWQHMRFHQGIKPFACPHEGCEARYTIRPDLKDHIRKVHTRERPFKCSVCNKCFLTGSVYYQHRLIHTNDRRYGCDVCQKRFFRADALNNHKRIHTDERPYACNVCGREFRQKGDRNKHLRTQHPEAIVN